MRLGKLIAILQVNKTTNYVTSGEEKHYCFYSPNVFSFHQMKSFSCPLRFPEKWNYAAINSEQNSK